MKLIRRNMSLCLVFSVVFLLCLPLSAQQKNNSASLPDKTDTDSIEVIVYYKEGIEKIQNNRVRVNDIIIKDVMTRFNVKDEDVRRTYPTFSEADTMYTNILGQRVKRINYARYVSFIVRKKEKTKQKEFIDELKKIRSVVLISE